VADFSITSNRSTTTITSSSNRRSRRIRLISRTCSIIRRRRIRLRCSNPWYVIPTTLSQLITCGVAEPKCILATAVCVCVCVCLSVCPSPHSHTTAERTAPEAEYICPAGFLCGWSVGVELVAGLPERPDSQQRHFLQAPKDVFVCSVLIYV